jgi:uncharacterized RDD family membrane protein YckC
MSTNVPASTPDVDYQVTGLRIVAGLIDIALMVALLFLMVALFGDFGPPEDQEGAQFGFYLGGLPFLAYVFLSFAYYIVAEAATGATIGKAVMGLKVVRADGEPYAFGSAFVRNVLRIVDGFFFYIVALICIAASQKRQRLGDMAAGTLVVRA